MDLSSMPISQKINFLWSMQDMQSASESAVQTVSSHLHENQAQNDLLLKLQNLHQEISNLVGELEEELGTEITQFWNS